MAMAFNCEDPDYGFHDSVMTKAGSTYGQCSDRFSALAQEWIFLSIVNYENGMVWNSFYRDDGVVAAHAEMYQPNWTLAWSDEFNGSSVNRNDWTFNTGGGGWGNNELQYYTDGANASIQDDGLPNRALVIEARRQSMGGYQYTSARMYTKAKHEFRYGRIEARIKLSPANGLWPAFWMLGSRYPDTPWPKSGAIDIMEHKNKDKRIYGTVTWDDDGINPPASHGCQSTSVIPVLDVTKYHIYSIEWDPNSIRWYVEEGGKNKKYCEINIRNSPNGTEELHESFFLLLNLAVGGNFPAVAPDNYAFPVKMYVDYVRVYKGTTSVEIDLGKDNLGKYYVLPDNVLVKYYPGMQNGPVAVKSKENYLFFTSQRVISGNSFNEVMGYPANQLTTDYWFPWYDNIDMATWVLVGNASSMQAAAVDIYIGGIKRGSYTIPVGGRITPRFNLQTGPVRVVSTNGAKIFTSERAVYNDSFNEVMGYPASQFTTEYWFPFYDNVGMSTWILVGNPSTTSTAAVDIYIGGVKRGSYSIPKGGRVTPRFNINPATGPVRVVSTNGVKIFTSERVVYGDSFNEVMGYPTSQLATEYFFPWYDNVDMYTWVLVGNPTGTAANVDIYIGGIKSFTATVQPGKQLNQRFPLNTGPVRVVSANGVKIFSSERVLYGDSFNEVMGYPGNQLTTEYWFPWYDSTSMSTDILVGRP
jgi:beta-glucanase (GH16 family)